MASLDFHALLVVMVMVCPASALTPPKSQVVKCAVCRSLVTELHSAVQKVDPRKKIDVGSYRIEADGNQKLSSVKYAGSELHMLEVMETVCGSMSDYAQARHKETGRLEAVKLVVDGKMNPHFSDYEMVQDPDLNKGLQFHCEAILEDYEDHIVEHFRTKAELPVLESQENFCTDITKICKDVRDEL